MRTRSRVQSATCKQAAGKCKDGTLAPQAKPSAWAAQCTMLRACHRASDRAFRRRVLRTGSGSGTGRMHSVVRSICRAQSATMHACMHA